VYDLALIDPPWPQRKGGKKAVRPKSSGRPLDYHTMPVPDIFHLLEKENLLPATVFLWTVDKFLREAEDEMAVRGYRLHARLIWDKMEGIPAAFTIRYSHEYLLWFYRSPMAPVARDMRGKFRDVFAERSRQHSRKPEVAYQMVEALYPQAARVDVFSREHREGWAAWGDQTGWFDG
jgi:N6-adenosine-specific RNA methylase IME4